MFSVLLLFLVSRRHGLLVSEPPRVWTVKVWLRERSDEIRLAKLVGHAKLSRRFHTF